MQVGSHTRLKALLEQLEGDKAHPASAVTSFRGLAARANYLSADRIDLQSAAKGGVRIHELAEET